MHNFSPCSFEAFKFLGGWQKGKFCPRPKFAFLPVISPSVDRKRRSMPHQVVFRMLIAA